MAQCPSCNEAIDYLHNSQTGQEVYEFYISPEGEAEYDRETFDPDGKQNLFDCPCCGFTVTDSEEEAVSFLNNNKTEHDLCGFCRSEAAVYCLCFTDSTKLYLCEKHYEQLNASHKEECVTITHGKT